MVKGAKWYWAGDSKGTQDAWVAYTPAVCRILLCVGEFVNVYDSNVMRWRKHFKARGERL